MKKKAISLLLALALCLGLLPAAYAAGPQPVSSSNINKQDYTTYGATVKSYLYVNPSGGLTRVEHTGGEWAYSYVNGQWQSSQSEQKIIVEDYSSSFQIQSSRTIPMELSIWGGFYAGKDYNFLVFGQNNEEENDQKEVIRVVKYSKDWQRLGQASLYGANTIHPFDAGSLRCDEYNGYLYIRTCHEMYTTSDGLNHQANLTFCVDQSSMAITDSYYDIYCEEYGYVSHSFNQFIIVDEDGLIVTLDHGDADGAIMSMRGVDFMRYYADAGTGKFTGRQYSQWCAYLNISAFAGRSGDNTTGGSIGGLAETTDCYIFSYNYDGQGGGGDRYPIYHYMDKATGKSWQVSINLPGSTTPVLASTGLDGGYMLWNAKSGNTVSGTLYYLHYGTDGVPEQYKTTEGSLSDCQPIYYNGKVVWYVTNNSAPVFYTLDASGVTATPAGGGAQPAEPENPAKPEKPTEPEAPTEPEEPTQPGNPQGGIMTNSNVTFLYDGDDSRITADGAAIISGVKLPGSGYTALALDTAMYRWYLLREDGTLWLADCHEIWGQAEGPTADDIHLTKLMDDVVQIQTGMVLQKDGTLWTTDYVEGSNNLLNKFMTGVKQICAGYDASFALKTDGTLWSWGYPLEHYGNSPNPALGWKTNVTSVDVYRVGPTKILDDVAYVADTMAIKADGTLWSWGYNDYGMVGDGSDYNQYTPVKVLDDVIGAWSVTDGAQSMKYALTKDGSVYSWGFNMGGVLGFEGGNKEMPASPILGRPAYPYQTVPRKSNLTGVVNIMDSCRAQKADGTVWEIGAGGFEKKVADNVKVLSGWPNVSAAQPAEPEPPVNHFPDFSDVPANNWAYEYVMACAEKGTVSGMGDGTFAPNGAVTYGQFAKMLTVTFFPETLEEYEPYNVSKPWYWVYMNAAYSLLAGTQYKSTADNNGSASTGGLHFLLDADIERWANQPMTRYDMAQMAFNTLDCWTAPYYDMAQGKIMGMSFTPYIPTYMAKLSDGGKIPSSYQEAITACMYAGIITGMEDGSFAGTETMTRAQACKVMVTLMDAIGRIKPDYTLDPITG